MEESTIAQIEEYVRKARVNGKSDIEIKEYMRESGYTEEEITTIFIDLPMPAARGMDPKTLERTRKAIHKSLKNGKTIEEIKEFMKRMNYTDYEISVVLSGVLTPASEELKDELSEMESAGEKGPEPQKEVNVKPEPVAKTQNICPKCGFNNKQGGRFCGGCGTKLYLINLFKTIK